MLSFASGVPIARRSNVPGVATMKIARIPAANAKFELADVEIPEPGPGHVRVKVHACGVCHSDSLTVDGALGNSFPRAPGHEVAGVVDAIGEGVTTWSVGDRVGVGWFGAATSPANLVAEAISSIARTARSPASPMTAATPSTWSRRRRPSLVSPTTCPIRRRPRCYVRASRRSTHSRVRRATGRPGRRPGYRRARPPRDPVRGQDGPRGCRDRARKGQGAVGERAWCAPLYRFDRPPTSPRS